MLRPSTEPTYHAIQLWVIQDANRHPYTSLNAGDSLFARLPDANICCGLRIAERSSHDKHTDLLVMIVLPASVSCN